MRYVWIIILLIVSCKSSQQNTDTKGSIGFTPDYTKGPPTIIYKTKKAYLTYVPVSLSEDKSRIVSYPGIEDLKNKDVLPVPLSLAEGYFLDRRGINKDVAFLKLTYEEYVALEKLPSLTEMYTWIIDKNPLTELCDCGSQKAFSDLEEQVNALIKNNELRSVCRVVK